MTIAAATPLASSTGTQVTASTRLVPAGSWKLGAGQAISLYSSQMNVLCIAQGRVWVTSDGPHVGPANNRGDVFLNAGERFLVPAGQRLVMESWNVDTGQPSYFAWDAHSASRSQTTTPKLRWHAAVVQPVGDLGVALSLAASALARLASGLAAMARFGAFEQNRGINRLSYKNNSELCPVDGDYRSI